MNNLAHDIFPPSDFSEITLLRSERSAIELHFNSFDPLDLAEIRFRPPGSLEMTRTYRRGKFGDATTFSWTVAVRALVYLLVQQRLATLRGEGPYRLTGGTASFAAALDYAITKQPRWLKCVFGESSDGVSHARRVFRRINSERKRGGEVVVSLTEFTGPRAIQIWVGGRELASEDELERVAQLTRGRGARLKSEASMDPRQLEDVPIVTSRLISSPAREALDKERAARDEWDFGPDYARAWRNSSNLQTALVELQKLYGATADGILIPYELHIDISILNRSGDARITKNLIAANIGHSSVSDMIDRMWVAYPIHPPSILTYFQATGEKIPWRFAGGNPHQVSVSLSLPDAVQPLSTVAVSVEYQFSRVFEVGRLWSQRIKPSFIRTSLSLRTFEENDLRQSHAFMEYLDGTVNYREPRMHMRSDRSLHWVVDFAEPNCTVKTFWNY